jgi:hypothetical protein
VPIDFFDFGAPNTSVPNLPEPIVEQGEHAYCKQTFLRE